MANATRGEVLDHATTYHRFMLGVKWFALHLATLIVFLTLWFATQAGFWAALIVALIVLAIGVFALTHGLDHSTESETLDRAGPYSTT